MYVYIYVYTKQWQWCIKFMIVFFLDFDYLLVF